MACGRTTSSRASSATWPCRAERSSFWTVRQVGSTGAEQDRASAHSLGLAVVPTRRLYAAFAVVALLPLLGQTGLAASLILSFLLAALAGVDWLLAHDLRRIRLEREIADKLSLGTWNPVALRLANPTGRGIPVQVRDVVPTDFQLDVQAPLFSLAAAPGEADSYAYHVRPRHRGDYQFGDLYLEAPGPLGLVRRQRRVPDSGCSVRVYPALRDLRKYDLLVRRGLLVEAGSSPVRAPGVSTEFERLRDYVPDDEFRRINWKATARRGRLIVNELEAERSQNLVIMLDTGRLMEARADLPGADEAEALTEGELPSGLAKLDWALNAAALLAYVASLRGDRTALLAYADRVRAFLPPARGRRAFLNVVGALYNVAAEPVEPDHGLAFQFLASRSLRRSLVVLFTDLADPESSRSLAAHLGRAARHHLVVCVTLRDPNVSRPALAHPTSGIGLYEKMVAQRLLEDRARVLAGLEQYSVVTVDTDADHLSPRLVNTYLDLKQRGRV